MVLKNNTYLLDLWLLLYVGLCIFTCRAYIGMAGCPGRGRERERDRVWKAAGKPKNGPIFDKRQSCRLIYRKRIRESQNHSLSSYSNDLHEALLHKNGPAFWKVWRSKFNNKNKPIEVDGCTDAKMIVNKFAHYFADSSSANNVTRVLSYMMSLHV